MTQPWWGTPSAGRRHDGCQPRGSRRTNWGWGQARVTALLFVEGETKSAIAWAPNNGRSLLLRGACSSSGGRPQRQENAS